jgi:BsuBI/PstI restriction endonuclease domain/BsuBI/PstI restriction endonuclease HTH domain
MANKRLVEKRIEEATEILRKIGLPIDGLTVRRRRRLGLALLALANMKPATPWEEASVFEGPASWKLTTRETIDFWNKHWSEKISSGSYDDVRRKDFIYLTTAGLALARAGNPNASTNNPTRRYGINPDAAVLLRKFGTKAGDEAAAEFVGKSGSLKQRFERERQATGVAAQLPDGTLLQLSAGAHNHLQKAIVEKFVPQFVRKPQVLYIGDTSKKTLHIEAAKLHELGFKELAHDILPDVVVYDAERNWLFLIEAVHSSNPISQLRHVALEHFTAACTAPRIYVSVFEDRAAFRKWVSDISWETEVWLAESPGHLIHFDGEKFLGPYKPD